MSGAFPSVFGALALFVLAASVPQQAAAARPPLNATVERDGKGTKNPLLHSQIFFLQNINIFPLAAFPVFQLISFKVLSVLPC